MALHEQFSPQIDKNDRNSSLQRVIEQEKQSFWDDESPIARILSLNQDNMNSNQGNLPTEDAMNEIASLCVTEKELYGYLFKNHPAVAKRYEVQEATYFAKTSQAGLKPRRDGQSTSDGHLNIATILASEFAISADIPVTPTFVITAQLHDCVEDGDVQTVTEISRHFGYTIASNVLLLSKKGYYLYITDSCKAIKIGIPQGIATMKKQQDTDRQSFWPQISMKEYMARLKECDIELQAIKLGDRAGNLLTDWNSIIHHDTNNTHEAMKTAAKQIEYVEETRNIILPPFIQNKRHDYSQRYIMKICYEIEKCLDIPRAACPFEEYFEAWCQEKMREEKSTYREKAELNRPF
ncbi:hypothetical protein BH09PAT2_BH09PAT2_03990 [soil metagenome]